MPMARWPDWRHDPCLPPPHHVVRSSRGRCQVLWRVAGISPAAAERYQRSIALHYGGDLAATDSARVGRWPGFRNYKYANPPFVTVASRLAPICGAEAFTEFLTRPDAPPRRETGGTTARTTTQQTGGSQSERDWQWTVRHLASGVPLDQLERVLALRRRDKHQPADYAARTVDAAWAALALRAGRSPDALVTELCARRYTRPSPSTYATAIVERAVVRTCRSFATTRS